MDQHVRFVRSLDGTSIAYADSRDGVPLVVSSNIWTHLDLTWNSDERRPLLELISQGFRLVRYDMRGMGMSDRDVSDFSLERQMEDLDAVRERTGLDRFALFGLVHATPACIAYAARHPERLTHLILSVPFANGAEWYGTLPTLRGLESFRELGDEQWELYTLTHATALAGLAPSINVGELAQLMRASTRPTTLKRYFDALQRQDVTGLLGQVTTPTMVIGSFLDDRLPFPRAVAAGIPDARLVRVERAGAPTIEDVHLLTRFVLGREPSPTGDAEGSTAPFAQGTAVILFADIVDSTSLTERVGDAIFRERARALDACLRAIISEHGGAAIEGKLLGDGVLATFPAAAQGIAAALECGRVGNEQGLPLHLGLHAGDVIREANNVFGGAVNIAARISALSAPAEVLVSDIVRGLARTSAGVTFEDRGDHQLKGVADPVRVFAVRPSG